MIATKACFREYLTNSHSHEDPRMIHAYSLRHPDEKIDYKAVLCFPLCSIQLSLDTTDGLPRKTAKSALKDILLEDVKPVQVWPKSNVVIVDVIALIHTITQMPDTIEGIAKMFINTIKSSVIRSQIRRIDLVADNYLQHISQIKRAEQLARGQSEPINISSLKSKTPSDFRERVLKNAANKSRLVELIFQYICENKKDVVELLNLEEIVMSAEEECLLPRKMESQSTKAYGQIKLRRTLDLFYMQLKLLLLRQIMFVYTRLQVTLM